MEPNTWLWILAGFLAAIFAGTGLLKLTTPRERLVEAGLGWAGGRAPHRAGRPDSWPRLG